jgi:hypothetical protein
MTKNFIDRQIKRQEEMEKMERKYGSIDEVPLEIKEKFIKETKKDMPLINSLHIRRLQEEIEDIKSTLILQSILIVLLSIGIFLKIFIK